MPETSNQLNIFEAKAGCIAPRKLHDPTSTILSFGQFDASTDGSVPVSPSFSDNHSCSRVGESRSKTRVISGDERSPTKLFRESSNTVTRGGPSSSAGAVRTPHHSDIGTALRAPQLSARVHCTPPRHACRAINASLSEANERGAGAEVAEELSATAAINSVYPGPGPFFLA